MTTFRQLSFSAGEISPALYGRVDHVKYATGLKTLKNFLVMRHGGVTNRAGTGWIGEVKYSSKKVRYIPFIFNADQTYNLEFGDRYMRVMRAGSYVKKTDININSISQSNPCLITISNTYNISNGDEIFISNVKGMTGLNGRQFTVYNVTIGIGVHRFNIKYKDGSVVNSTLFPAYTSGGIAQVIYEISTPYFEADLSNIRYTQSGDVITLSHSAYPQTELTRTGHTAWTLSNKTYSASISPPAGVAVVSGGAGSKTYKYKVTTIAEESLEESLPSSLAQITLAAVPTSTAPHSVTWAAASGAISYNVYRELNNLYCWVGIADGTSFSDIGYTPDMMDNPPEDRQPFSGTGNYPATACYHQQRLLSGGSDNEPETIYGSKIGLDANMMMSSPMQDDDPVTFTLAGRLINRIKHMIEMGKLYIFTDSGEWRIEGDQAGTITPSIINPRQYTANGIGSLPPLVVGNSIAYVQGRGSVVRDLSNFQAAGYEGNEISIFSPHLIEGYQIKDWVYQSIPQATIWCVRNDGVLLAITYVREQEVIGWSKHEFENGIGENVCVISEGDEDVLYLCIKREINGRTVRYNEYMKTRKIVNSIADSVFVDSSLTYDGRNTTSDTMTLSGSGTWTYEDAKTLTCSSSATFTFSSDDVGNQIYLTGSDNTIIRSSITAYLNPVKVTVKPNKDVPVSMQNIAISTWSKAVDVISGLWHLEGEDVSIFADGFVSANPNNIAYKVKSVASGTITLEDPHSVVHIGLPITADLETLNIDTNMGQFQSLADKQKKINRVTLFVESSRGIWIGNDGDSLTEFKTPFQSNPDLPTELRTGTISINIRPEWNSSGHVFIRQTDPLPLSILSIVPAGSI